MPLLNRLVATISPPHPCAGEIPTQNEAFEQVEYVRLLEKQKIECGVNLPVEEIVDAEEESLKRLMKRTAPNAAPAWFAPAMAQALEQALQPIHTELREIRQDLARVNNRSS
mmetsp:Transcript_14001/g.20940  ORF Transcript_14001/g.20940 Transcript_14001/m.20940 type:complete len:112 (+) Transcript_14001:162-497(+)